MSIKSFIQILILIVIVSIVGATYFKYFDTQKNVIEQINTSEILKQEKIDQLEGKISDLELKNNELINELKNIENKSEILTATNINEKGKDVSNLNYEKKKTQNNEFKVNKKALSEKKDIIKNFVKDIEYTSIDQKGNKFHLLANSGKSNNKNNDILDLINVRGKITSENRDTIYIVSDFAQYNSVNLNSKFYENVIINYQDKEITCINFDIIMENNKAIAYNNVVIKDPKSTMKAGIVEFDLKTKDINIKPESTLKKIEVITD
tara:strand:- start:4501 stop:5292 length:792 start_codon:yes stop_codon:yes gene_type:complete